MKQSIFILTLLAALLTSGKVAALTADPSVTGAAVSPAPISADTGISVAFNFANLGGSISSAQAGFVQVTISLSKLGLPSGYNLSTAISGTAATWFNWVYDSATSIITGTLNKSVAQAAGGTITVNGLIVTALSGPAAPSNGANINVIAASPVNSSTTNDNTSSFTFTTAGVTPLPVELIGFYGNASACAAALSWKTAGEENLDHFLLQSSTDGIGFGDIATVAATGNNSHYAFTHHSAAGRRFYRLAMIGADGHIGYSNTLALTISCQDMPSVFLSPNPATTFADLQVCDAATGYQASATLVDAVGKTVFIQSVGPGHNRLDVSSLPAGIYHLLLRDRNGSRNYVLTKQ